MSRVVVNNAHIQNMRNVAVAQAGDPGTNLAQELDRAAEALLINAKFTLGAPRVASNPPPGPPRRRSGDLLQSLRVARPHGQSPALSGGMRGVFYVIADAAIASHKDKRGSYYPRWLLDHGYKFLSTDLPTDFEWSDV